MLVAHLFRNGYLKTALMISILALISWILTFSTISEIALIPVLIFSWYFFEKKETHINLLIILIVLLVLLILVLTPSFLYSFYWKFNQSGLNGRLENTFQATSVFFNASFLNMLVGYGPGSFYSFGLKTGIYSLPLLVLFESGLIGILITFIIIYFVVKEVFRFEDVWMRFAAILSGSFALIHYLAIGNFWYPWVRFFIAWVFSESSNYKPIKKTSSFDGICETSLIITKGHLS